MSKRAMVVLIAMWLWCVAAAGETITVPLERWQRGNGTVRIPHPCDWDENLDTVSVFAFYGASDTDLVKVPVEPTSKSRSGKHVRISFAPTLTTYKDLPLHHLEASMATTGAICKEDFKFKQGNFVR